MLTKDQLYNRYDVLCDIYNDLRLEKNDTLKPTISMLEKAIQNFDDLLRNGELGIRERKSKLVKVKIDDGALLPNTDVGLHLKSPVDGLILARSRGRIDTGVHVSIPKGTVGIIKTISSLNAEGIQCEGVIDDGYTGEISIILENHNDHHFIVERGDRIAQLVILPVIRPEIELVDELEETERGDKGFGSSGK